MKKWDILVVRFLPFLLFVIFGLNIIFSFFGGYGLVPYEIHGNSSLYALGLFIISLSNKKYHCVWNRAMYLFLIIVPLFNYLEATLCLLPTWDAYVYVVSTAYILTAIATAYLAIRHFIQMTMKRYYARIRKQSNADNERGDTNPQVRN